jgi:putative acetyltransferase
MSNVVFLTTDAADPALLELLERLDSYLSGLYPAESNYASPLEALRRANALFVVAQVDGQAVGCGGYVIQDDQSAEFKRFMVLPAFRGQAIGSRILVELESLVRIAGVTIARLETGVSQPDAIRVFEKAGYRRCSPFGNYPDDPLCVFMEKALLEPMPS